VSVVNALSQKLTATVRRDGQAHALSFVRGKSASTLEVSPLDLVSAADGAGSATRAVPWMTECGTEISFRPDHEIFKTSEPSNDSSGDDDNEPVAATIVDEDATAAAAAAAAAPLTGVFEYKRLSSRMDELAYLHPNLNLTLVEARSGMVRMDS